MTVVVSVAVDVAAVVAVTVVTAAVAVTVAAVVVVVAEAAAAAVVATVVVVCPFDAGIAILPGRNVPLDVSHTYILCEEYITEAGNI